MPTYEFRCPNGHEFEKFYRSISSAESQAVCPECGLPAERMMSAAGFAFKGSGFYLTDYGKNAHRGEAPPEKKSGESSSGESAGDSSKSDSGASSTDSKSSASSSESAKSSESSSSTKPEPKAEKKTETKASDSKPAKAPPKPGTSE
jgi:putative FmdB family regulatory protein